MSFQYQGRVSHGFATWNSLRRASDPASTLREDRIACAHKSRVGAFAHSRLVGIFQRAFSRVNWDSVLFGTVMAAMFAFGAMVGGMVLLSGWGR